MRDPPAGDEDAPKPVGYYGEPLLRKPHWGWNVVAYLFLGGIMGGSSIVVTFADERDESERKLARNGRYAALALAVACPAILISHLGRPERFLNMLRIVKFRSPMSLGVWGLVAYGNVALLSALAQSARGGTLPRWMRYLAPRPYADVPSALFGAFIASYTGVLISATAVPLWAKGKRHIPPLFVFSGVTGACALHAALLALEPGTHATRRKLERLELIAALGELAALALFCRHAGVLGAPMFQGPRGERLRNHTVFGGIVAPSLLNLLPVGGRLKTVLSAVLTLAGGYVLRETVIEAGKASADDAKAAFAQPE
jgi:formate-dependent nitrite reductase membrane component NrfD